MMDEQKIIDNAQDNATHYDCCEYMRHVHNGNWEYWSKASGWEETVPEDDTRSLADIKKIVELRKANAELKKLLSLVKKDLLMRAEEDSDGCKVVNLSSFIWIKLKETLKAGN
jgi:hypothetical protein